MKIFVISLCFLAINCVFVSSFAVQKPFVTPDGDWPNSCPVPECEKIDKSVRYPSPIARHFYQCTFDGKRWIPQLVPCPCDLLFSYKDQQCVYPWNLQQWCTSDYVADILPIRCE